MRRMFPLTCSGRLLEFRGFPVDRQGDFYADAFAIVKVGCLNRAAVVLSNNSDNVKTHAKVQSVVGVRFANGNHGVEYTFQLIFRDGGASVGDEKSEISRIGIDADGDG